MQTTSHRKNGPVSTAKQGAANGIPQPSAKVVKAAATGGKATTVPPSKPSPSRKLVTPVDLSRMQSVVATHHEGKIAKGSYISRIQRTVAKREAS